MKIKTLFSKRKLDSSSQGSGETNAKSDTAEGDASDHGDSIEILSASYPGGAVDWDAWSADKEGPDRFLSQSDHSVTVGRSKSPRRDWRRGRKGNGDSVNGMPLNDRIRAFAERSFGKASDRDDDKSMKSMSAKSMGVFRGRSDEIQSRLDALVLERSNSDPNLGDTAKSKKKKNKAEVVQSPQSTTKKLRGGRRATESDIGAEQVVSSRAIGTSARRRSSSSTPKLNSKSPPQISKSMSRLLGERKLESDVRVSPSREPSGRRKSSPSRTVRSPSKTPHKSKSLSVLLGVQNGSSASESDEEGTLASAITATTSGKGKKKKKKGSTKDSGKDVLDTKDAPLKASKESTRKIEKEKKKKSKIENTDDVQSITSTLGSFDQFSIGSDSMVSPKGSPTAKSKKKKEKDKATKKTKKNKSKSDLDPLSPPPPPSTTEVQGQPVNDADVIGALEELAKEIRDSDDEEDGRRSGDEGRTKQETRSRAASKSRGAARSSDESRSSGTSGSGDAIRPRQSRSHSRSRGTSKSRRESSSRGTSRNRRNTRSKARYPEDDQSGKSKPSLMERAWPGSDEFTEAATKKQQEKARSAAKQQAVDVQTTLGALESKALEVIAAGAQREEVLKLQTQLGEALQKVVLMSEEQIQDKDQFLKTSTELSRVRAELAEALSERGELVQALKIRDATMQEDRERIHKLEQAIENQLDVQDAMELKLERAEDEIEKLLMEMQEMETRMSNGEKGGGVSLVELREVKKALAEREEEVAAQRARIEQLEKELKDSLTVPQLQIEDLDQENKALQGKLRGERLEAAAKIAAKEETIARLRQELDTYAGSSDAQDMLSARQKLNEARADASAVRGDLETAKKMIEELQGEREDLIARNNVLKENAVFLERSVIELTEKSDSLNSKVLEWTERTYEWKSKAESAERKLEAFNEDKASDFGGSETSGEVTDDAPQGLFLQAVMDKKESIEKKKNKWNIFLKQSGDQDASVEEIRIRTLEDRNEGLEEVIADLRSEIVKMQTAHKEELYNTQKKIAQLEGENEALSLQNLTLEGISRTQQDPSADSA